VFVLIELNHFSLSVLAHRVMLYLSTCQH